MTTTTIRYQEFWSTSGKLIASAATYAVYKARSQNRVRKVIEHEVFDWRTQETTPCPHFEAATLLAATLAHHA